MMTRFPASLPTFPTGRFVLILAGLLFFAVQVVLQLVGGAFGSEFGGYPDEASHYITGLMVHDYIADFRPVSPMSFAENYYLYYPKVALGHWPPFFYVVQAIWMLLFSPSRVSLILLLAFLTTLLAITVYLALRAEFGSYIGIGAGLLLIALPLVQIYSGMVMAEVLVALLAFWAALCFWRFLDTEEWRYSIGFTVFAVLTILTKGNGLALALVPPLALLFSRRFHLLKRPSFWCPIVFVLLLCGPWYWFTLDMVRDGMKSGSPNLEFTASAIPYYSLQLVKVFGIGLSFVAAIGFFARVIKPCWYRGADGRWASVGALLIGVWVFHCVVPAGLESRHLITVVPAMLMFLAAGISSISARLPLPGLGNEQKTAVLALAITLAFAVETFAIPKQERSWYGFGEVAEQLLSEPDFRDSVVMVSSDSRGEGMLISEVAMRERRPGHLVLRASKILSRSRWDGTGYELLYSTPGEIMSRLKKIPVGIVVIDYSIPVDDQTEHHRLLEKTMKVYAERWELLGSYPLTRKGTVYSNAIRVYRLVGHENRRVGRVHLDVREMLGEDVEKVLNGE